MAAAADVPDGFSDLFDFGHDKRKLSSQDVINPVNDLDEKEEELRGWVTITDDGKDFYYPTNHKDRGVCLLIENEKFHQDLNVSYRGGSNADSNAIKKCFKSLGFKDIRYEKDLRAGDIKKKLKRLAAEDHGSSDMLVVVVLSHGSEGNIYAYDKAYETSVLWEQFTGDKCPSLIGKPKLFFLQACQGLKMDPGVVRERGREGHDGGDGFASYRTPSHSDFLVAHSSVDGYYSWRNTVQGSWFIQVLAAALLVNGQTRDLDAILTRVARVLAYEYESKNKSNAEYNHRKQTPFFYSTLTAKVCFKQK